jgi:hypothetical protein
MLTTLLHICLLLVVAQALSACLLVPVLLGVIRQVQAQQGPTAAAAVAVGGLLLLLACDRISRAAVKQQAAAQATCVTAATLQQRLETGGSCVGCVSSVAGVC